METVLAKSGDSFEIKMTVTPEELSKFEEMMNRETGQLKTGGSSGIKPMGIFDSSYYCVTVVDSAARPIYRETIKTHPIWAPIRAYGVMRDHGGSGYQLTGGEC